MFRATNWLIIADKKKSYCLTDFFPWIQSSCQILLLALFCLFESLPFFGYTNKIKHGYLFCKHISISIWWYFKIKDLLKNFFCYIHPSKFKKSTQIFLYEIVISLSVAKNLKVIYFSRLLVSLFCSLLGKFQLELWIFSIAKTLVFQAIVSLMFPKFWKLFIINLTC